MINLCTILLQILHISKCALNFGVKGIQNALFVRSSEYAI